MPSGPPNGTHKPGLYPAGYPMPRVPLPAYHGATLSQPYAIPTRGAVHGPVGAVPHGPQPGNRGFGAGRGSSGTPIGGHLRTSKAPDNLLGVWGPLSTSLLWRIQTASLLLAGRYHSLDMFLMFVLFGYSLVFLFFIDLV